MKGRAKWIDLFGQVLFLAGMVGFVSPWLPDPDNYYVNDDLTGWGLVIWLLVCLITATGAKMLSRFAEKIDKAD